MTFPKSQRSHAVDRGFRPRASDTSFCCDHACRIPALLAATAPQGASRACGAHLSLPGWAAEGGGPAGTWCTISLAICPITEANHAVWLRSPRS